MSDDELFATLSGGLMKDLLADLSVDDGEPGWMSLEELEKELAHLEKGSGENALSAPLATTPEPASAAAMVMASNSGRIPSGPASTTNISSNPSVDAWSRSFQQFSATSLEEDFLQADSARKQQQQRPSSSNVPPGLDLSTAQDYNVNESPRVLPPPGMRVQTAASSGNEPSDTIMLNDAAAKLVTQLQNGTSRDQVGKLPSGPPASTPSIPKPAPATPHNSVTLPDGYVAAQRSTPQRSNVPPTPPPSAAATPQHPRQVNESAARHSGGFVPHMPSGNMMPSSNMMPPQGMPPQGIAPPTGMPMHPPVIPVAVPVRGPAWQQAPVPPPSTQPRYCDPHPRAPSIPATQLESKYMSSRDIGYVVHGILRHIQAAGASSVDDYDVQYWVRRNGSKAAEQAVLSRPSPQKNDAKDKDLESATEATLAILDQRSRQAKAMEWSSERGTLGHVSKTNVHRPRALIAQPLGVDGSGGNEQKQRATLWKARIYTDQAYQAFNKVMELWREAPPGQVPTSMQPHLMKLLKCMGVQKVAEQEQEKQIYIVSDEDAMSLLLKLDKGKILLARVLEQALLPPRAVQICLPVLSKILLASSSASKLSVADTIADNRIFSILSRIVESLPGLSPQTIIESAEAFHHSIEQALSSTSRMQCMHSLLQRGGLACQDPAASPDFKNSWTRLEKSFVEILSSL